MATIRKFPLNGEDEQHVRMPAGARILTAQMQHGVPQIWAIVEPNNVEVDRTVYIVPTGGDVPEQADYVATIQVAGGDYIFHVFAGRAAHAAGSNDGR